MRRSVHSIIMVAWFVFASLRGKRTLLGSAPSRPFVPAATPWDAFMALLLAVVGSGFLRLLDIVEKTTLRLRVPAWLRPGIGGLMLGVCARPVVMLVGPRIG